MSLKLISPLFFMLCNVATRNFIIAYVAHIFLLDSIALLNRIIVRLYVGENKQTP